MRSPSIPGNPLELPNSDRSFRIPMQRLTQLYQRSLFLLGWGRSQFE
ncbi:hypothetical protein NDI37_21920 [Funiculus sociatus GB2-A5]|uniref:Uncharacterized protein n=1 Tax=Funiculus sociatus GB2-A5 TaxID=2933946 RepID=A0ABV0JWU8_9CYAN|nr:hypothetical protein [Trichocoleus sp. FACHB-6]MBD2060754.1 hypothetical protein [Trichocoleus sp. FACHB-6]